MFERTRWRITTWNSDTVGLTIAIGLGGGALDIGLRHGGERHTLHCVGVSGAVGLGLPISLPGSALGFDANIRTQGGTLYKNTLTVPGDLTLDHLRDGFILVIGLELVIADEGQAGYFVKFASTLSTLGSFAAAAAGLLGPVVEVASCQAATFLSAGQAGLPNAALAGYRYRVIGAS